MESKDQHRPQSQLTSIGVLLSLQLLQDVREALLLHKARLVTTLQPPLLRSRLKHRGTRRLDSHLVSDEGTVDVEISITRNLNASSD